MNNPKHHLGPVSRRDFLKSVSCGFGYLAFAGLSAESSGYRNPLAPRQTHFTPRAKRVIFMFMQGGPTHLDTFDYKPELSQADGQQHTIKYFGQQLSGKLLGSRFKFEPQGQSGLMISELFPALSTHADDLCLLNGMHTDNAAHPQAAIALHTGSITFVRPSLGAWVVYGLGTSNQNLPGFVTIDPPTNVGGAQNYGSAFLPATYQGTRIGDVTARLPNINNPHLSTAQQRRQLDFVQSLNHDLLGRAKGNQELEGVIESYELAFRMQAAVPDVMDLGDEPEHVKAMYGIDKGPSKKFGTQCLMARRFAESGVRFIQLNLRGWDQHNNLKKRLSANCQAIDQPIAALMTDLKQRGMFEDTLLVWGGEFGRTPQAQNPQNDGRRHNNRGYSMWMAGGGVKGGIRYGATDPLGGFAVEDKMHTHDLHATILHLMGLDHERLTYRYAGRDFRLTDVAGEVALKTLV